jgi:hypothetical protein
MQPTSSLEHRMNKPKNCIPPALKHGVYSGMTLLPSEDPAEFEKFRQEIIAEYNPVGRSEEDIVENLCRLMWRRQNLSIYRLAEWAKAERQRIREKFIPSDWEGLVEALGPPRSPAERDALREKRRRRMKKPKPSSVRHGSSYKSARWLQLIIYWKNSRSSNGWNI